MRTRGLAGPFGVVWCVVWCVVGSIVASAAIACAAAALMAPAVVEPAVAIAVSLADDSMKGVQDNAALIETEAAKLTPPATKLAAAAKALRAAEKITEARTAFGRMNDELMAYMKAHKLSVDATTKMAYCPMANKPWLQKAASIRNPYYGSEMLTCGNFTK